MSCSIVSLRRETRARGHMSTEHYSQGNTGHHTTLSTFHGPEWGQDIVGHLHNPKVIIGCFSFIQFNKNVTHDMRTNSRMRIPL